MNPIAFALDLHSEQLDRAVDERRRVVVVDEARPSRETRDGRVVDARRFPIFDSDVSGVSCV
jgi:hypothetical protein